MNSGEAINASAWILSGDIALQLFSRKAPPALPASLRLALLVCVPKIFHERLQGGKTTGLPQLAKYVPSGKDMDLPERCTPNEVSDYRPSEGTKNTEICDVPCRVYCDTPDIEQDQPNRYGSRDCRRTLWKPRSSAHIARKPISSPSLGRSCMPKTYRAKQDQLQSQSFIVAIGTSSPPSPMMTHRAKLSRRYMQPRC